MCQLTGCCFKFALQALYFNVHFHAPRQLFLFGGDIAQARGLRLKSLAVLQGGSARGCLLLRLGLRKRTGDLSRLKGR